MARWDIDPEGVRGVVTRTATVAGGFETHSRNYGTHLEGAASAAGGLSGMGGEGGPGLVGLALAQFAEASQPDWQFLADRTRKSLEGTVKATNAYVRGDETMAQEAQRQALSAPTGPGERAGGPR